MKIETQPRDDHQMTLTVTLEQEQLEKAKRRAARKLSKQVKIPGFRPGKAPYDVIRTHLGEGAIIEEAIEMLIDEIYPQALKEADLEPAAPGNLEDVSSLEPPVFVFTVPLKPTVDLGAYQDIRKPYEFETPDDEAVQKALDDLRRMYARTEEVERPIEDGDYVLANVVIKEAEGEEPAVLAERENYAFVVRAEPEDDEWPFKGFSKKLIGMSVGDAKTMSKKFPQKAEDEALRGKATKITVTINTVRALQEPELNDEFAKMAGATDLAQLRDVIRENLIQQAQAEYDDTYYAELLDEIKAQATIQYPPQLLENEIEVVLQDLERRLASQGLTLELYLKTQETDKETFIEKEVRPVAIKRLERSLLMDEIARAEKIEPSEAELEAEFQSFISELQYNGQVDLSELKTKRQQREFAEIATVEAANRLMTRSILERLKAIASGAAEAEEETAEAAEAEPAEETPAEAAESETQAEA